MRDLEITIPDENPFQNCFFYREKYADIVQNLIDNNTDGFVLALNNSWGAGKTTFIKMFERKLKNEQYEVVSFNAWENDYQSDPFVSILGEFRKIKYFDNKNKAQDIISIGAKILYGAGVNLLKNSTGVDLSLLDDTSKDGKNLLNSEIDNYLKRKDSIEEFKKVLKEYLRQNETNKPLVFIIDELDRCKPDYAISFLENIKHFFSVEGIVFILSIDKKQLGSAVKGFYGSDEIDSDEYLKKIIDIELSLPDPDYKDYIHKKTKDFIFPDLQKFYIGIYNNGIYPDFYDFFCLIFLENGSSTRKLNKILSHCYLSVLCFNDYKKLNVLELFYLIYLKDENNSLYLSIKNNKFDNNVLTEELIRLFEKAKSNKFLTKIIFDLLIFFDIDFPNLNPDLFKKIQKIGSVNLDNDPNLKIMRNEFNNNNMREPSDYIPIIEFLYNE